MVRCSEDCIPVCDYCKHFDFNGEKVPAADGTGYALVYTGNGHCRLHNRHADPEDWCEDFHCFRAR